MAGLSISRAWLETKARIAADGRLMMIVALALIALPGALMGVVRPSGAADEGSAATLVLMLVASLIGLIGQLAIIRLAIGRSVSVSEAIGHGARRMPIYFLAALLIALVFFLLAIPFVVVMMAAGVPLEPEALAASPVTAVAVLAYLLVLIFIGVRMLMSSPVASEEPVGPIGILRRSWQLTAGHWWRLFGFLILFLIALIIATAAISWAVALVAVLLFGPIEPMSGSALLVAVVTGLVNAAVTVLLAVMLARIYVQLAGEESVDVTVPRSGT